MLKNQCRKRPAQFKQKKDESAELSSFQKYKIDDFLCSEMNAERDFRNFNRKTLR